MKTYKNIRVFIIREPNIACRVKRIPNAERSISRETSYVCISYRSTTIRVSGFKNENKKPRQYENVAVARHVVLLNFTDTAIRRSDCTRIHRYPQAIWVFSTSIFVAAGDFGTAFSRNPKGLGGIGPDRPTGAARSEPPRARIRDEKSDVFTSTRQRRIQKRR